LTNGNDQLRLFATHELQGSYAVDKPVDLLEMSKDALQAWKQRVFDYQQQVKVGPPIQQNSLFELATSPDYTDPDSINPFLLPQQNTQFWRWKAEDHGVAALYFVIDYELPILLYVGETVKSNQRWKGEHDCKRYLLNYRQTHYHTQTATSLGIAFWPNAPTQTRPRQRLESALIYKWRSPFNKENWHIWGTPFIREH
jgi:hypothetical protein